MNRKIFAGVLVTICILCGCGMHHIQGDGTRRIVVYEETKANPWTHLNFNNNLAFFQFAIVSDRTGHARPGVFEKAIEKLNLLQPEFVVCIGELIEGYTKNEAEMNRQWEKFDCLVQQLEMPFFYVPGNHDISNPNMERKWQERRGRSYYHFIYNDVLFLILNSEDQSATPPGNISESQIDYLAGVLEDNCEARWTFVFLHKPLWLEEKESGWKQVEEILQDRPYTMFAGHLHEYAMYKRNGHRYIHLATTGGGSDLWGPTFGGFDQIVWITMTDDGPRIANLDINGILEEDIATEDSRQLAQIFKKEGLITSDAILVDKPIFDGATPHLYLNNTADFPIHFQGRFQEHLFLRVDPMEIDIDIPPMTEESLVVPLRIEATESIKVDKIEPLELAFTMSKNLYGQKPIELDWTYRLVINEPIICTPRQAPVIVEGDLNEWTELPHSCHERQQVVRYPSAWKGPDDCSFSFAVEYDGDFVYVALEVIDDSFIFDNEKLPWAYDGLMLYLDARPEPERSKERGEGKNVHKRLLVLWINPGRTVEEMVLLPRPEDLPKGMQVVSVITDNGYTMEMAVPVAYLNEKQGGPWREFRLNIGLADLDEVDGPQPQMWWRPRWSDPDNDPGSGTFVRH